MVIKGSAAKRYRQSLKRRTRNRAMRSKVRTEIRGFLDAVDGKDKSAAETRLQSVTKLIDTAAGKGVYHKNTAARTKSRLRKKLNAL
ncbi:MAG: 30S ribosomal protein S20 [Spirochaetes bacterium]|nr:30S ribosomal protein S20 [Spirochaetota bacterium]